MIQPLPMTNQCHKCKEWFHTVHVCPGSVKLRDCCDYCDDGDGHSIFPYYGTAPHIHAGGDGWIGSTQLLPRAMWGSNFREDPECEGHGVYMRCQKCGRGEQPEA